MCLSNDIAKVTVQGISKAASFAADVVLDFENYREEKYKSILLIEIETELSKERILLYCDLCGDFECCTILR